MDHYTPQSPADDVTAETAAAVEPEIGPEILDDVDEPEPEIETPEDRFRRIAGRRANAALKQLSLLENTADTSSYAYTPEQAQLITGKLHEALERLEIAYAGRPTLWVSL